MKVKTLLAIALFSAVGHAETPTTDFPAGTDWTAITRPSGSIIAAASHTDYDEFAVPMGPNSGSKFAKTLNATGAVDYLAYSGPPTTSTLQNFSLITAQLASEGYKPIFTCVREACGGFQFAVALATPLINTLDGTGYHNFAVETLYPVGGDVRYTAFQRGSEYLCILATLAPGKHSGVLLINVGGKNPPPPTGPSATAPAPDPVNGPTSTSSPDVAVSNVRSKVRSRLGSLLRPN